MGENLNPALSSLQATVCPSKPIYEVVVDPDRAHLGESFVIDMRKVASSSKTRREFNVNADQRNDIALNLMRMASSDAKVDQNPKKVGRVIPNIQDVDHSHPANVVPEKEVGPPKIKVFFDMPGLGSISFKYHKVITLANKNQIIFVTDKRHGGSAEFYPYCNMRSSEEKKPVGVYVEGDDKLILLDPSVKGFPIKFDCEPFEFCIIPVGGFKPLDSAMIRELGIVNSSVGESHGKESGDSGGNNPDDSSGEYTGGLGDYESVEGGSGGVL